MNFISSIYGTATNIVIAIAIFLISFIIGRFLGRFITRILIEAGLQQILEKLGFEWRLSDFLGNLVSYLIYIAGLWLAFDQIGLTKIITIILILFGLLLTGLAITFGIHEFIKNFFIGLVIRKKYAEKKKVFVKGIHGIVIKNSMTQVIIKTKKDNLVIPYTAFLEKEE